MKNLIRTVLLTMLVAVSTLTIAQTKGLGKAGVTSSGVFELETFKFILNNKSQIPRKQWYLVERTGQQIRIDADLTNYCMNLSPADINGLIVLDAKDVKSGKYRNNGYDYYGKKVPVQDNYLPILAGYSYFCTKDSVAVAKTNCINEQDYQPSEEVTTYVPEQPRREPKPAPEIEVPLMAFVPCWNTQIEMEKTLVDGVGRWSKDHSIYFENNKWYTPNGDGSVSELNCTPPVAQVQTRVVYVQQQCCQQVQQPIVYTQANSCACPSTMGRAYSYQAPPFYSQPQPVYVSTRTTNFSFGISLSPGGGQYPQYPPYVNRTQVHPQYGTPSVFQAGTPFDTGSQVYYPTQNGGSFDTGTYAPQTGGAPYTGQGYIPGVAERVQ